MGVSLLRSIAFFVFLLIFAFFLFPTQREMGRLYVATGRFDKALFFLASQYRVDPEDINNARRYILSMMNSPDYFLVSAVGPKISAAFPHDWLVHKLLAEYYDSILAEKRSTKELQKAFAARPQDIDIRDKVISRLEKQKDDKGLLNVYDMLIRKGKGDNADWYYRMARIFLSRGDAVAAERIYLEMLKSHPTEIKARLDLADIYDFLGEKKKAAILYVQLAPLMINDREFRWVLMEKLIECDMFEELDRLFFSSGSIDPRLMPMLQEAYTARGKKEAVYLIMEKILAASPDDPVAVRVMADIYFERKEYQKTKELLEKYNKSTGGDYRSYHILGDIYSKLGDDAGGRREYETALELIRKERKAGQ